MSNLGPTKINNDGQATEPAPAQEKQPADPIRKKPPIQFPVNLPIDLDPNPQSAEEPTREEA
jgi:hypothetical protein